MSMTRESIATWFDKEWDIDYNLVQEGNKYFLSVNGQGHFPIDEDEARGLIEKHA